MLSSLTLSDLVLRATQNPKFWYQLPNLVQNFLKLVTSWRRLSLRQALANSIAHISLFLTLKYTPNGVKWWPVRPVRLTCPQGCWTGRKYRPVRVKMESLLVCNWSRAEVRVWTSFPSAICELAKKCQPALGPIVLCTEFREGRLVVFPLDPYFCLRDI